MNYLENIPNLLKEAVAALADVNNYNIGNKNFDEKNLTLLTRLVGQLNLAVGTVSEKSVLDFWQREPRAESANTGGILTGYQSLLQSLSNQKSGDVSLSKRCHAHVIASGVHVAFAAGLINPDNGVKLAELFMENFRGLSSEDKFKFDYVLRDILSGAVVPLYLYTKANPDLTGALLNAGLSEVERFVGSLDKPAGAVYDDKNKGILLSERRSSFVEPYLFLHFYECPHRDFEYRGHDDKREARVSNTILISGRASKDLANDTLRFCLGDGNVWEGNIALRRSLERIVPAFVKIEEAKSQSENRRGIDCVKSLPEMVYYIGYRNANMLNYINQLIERCSKTAEPMTEEYCGKMSERFLATRSGGAVKTFKFGVNDFN